jgi:outer membrane protein assembly factor BamB
VALGKDGRIYLLNRNNLGGISAPVSSATVSTSYIINSAVVYRTANTTYVLFRGPGSGCPSGQSGAFTAVKLTAASPPTAAIAWCAGAATLVSASVSMTDAQGSNALVWTVGSDNRLRALDATTGQTVYAGGSSTDVMSSVQRYQAPVVANGRVFVAANNRVYAFAPQ